MEISVTIHSAKNLSQSTLITKHLYSTLQVGSSVRKLPRVDGDDVRFTAANGSVPVVISLTNNQTETIMYVRNVPLSLATNALPAAVTMWIAVYPPGDHRNDTFDESAPVRPDVAQLHLTLQCLSRSSLEPRQSKASLDRSPQLSCRPSNIDGDMEIARYQHIADEGKAKIVKMQEEKRLAKQQQSQLSDITREVEKMREDVEKAENDLHRLLANRSKLDLQKRESVISCGRAREALEQRNIAIIEARHSRETMEERYSQVVAKQRERRSAMDMSSSTFTVEFARLSAELDRCKAQETDFSEQIRRCDHRLAAMQDLGATPVQSSAELSSLETQLDEAIRELEEVRRSEIGQREAIRSADERVRSVTERLSGAEARAAENQKMQQLAADSDERNRMVAFEMRAELDVRSRELVSHMNRVAVLEGQVDENKNQCREMEIRRQNCLEKVSQRHAERQGIEDTITGLRGVVLQKELDGEQLRSELSVARAQLQRAREDIEGKRQQVAELQHATGKDQLEETRRVDSLDMTRVVLGTELLGLERNLERLRQDRTKLSSDAETQRKDMERSSTLLDETMSKVMVTESDLERRKSELSERNKKRDEAARRQMDIDAELETLRRELRDADEEAASLLRAVQTQDAGRRNSEEALEKKLAQLRGDIETKRADLLAADERHRVACFSAEENEQLVKERQNFVNQLRVTEEALRQDRERLEAEVGEARSSMEEHFERKRRLEDGLRDRRNLLASAQDDVACGVTRESDLQRALEKCKTDWIHQVQLLRTEVGEVQGGEQSSVLELERLRASRAKLEGRRLALSEAARDTAERLATIERQVQDGGAVDGVHAEVAKAEIDANQEAQRVQELAEKLGQLEAQLAADTGRHARLHTDQSTFRRQLKDTETAIELCDRELVLLQTKKCSVPDARITLEHAALVSQEQELLRRLSTLDVETERSTQLRREIDAVCGRLADTREGQWLRELERDVANMHGVIQSHAAAKAELVRRLGRAEADEDTAVMDLTARSKEVVSLHQGMESLAATRSHFQNLVSVLEQKLDEGRTASNVLETSQRAQDMEVSLMTSRVDVMMETCQESREAVRNNAVEIQMRCTDAAHECAVLEGEASLAERRHQIVADEMNQRRNQCIQLAEALKLLTVELQAADVQRKVAKAQAESHLTSLLDHDGDEPAPTVDLAAEEQVHLLMQQHDERKGALMKAQDEIRTLSATKKELLAEREVLLARSRILEEKLARQMELSGFQFATIEHLEKDIAKSEGESGLLTLGLHEAELLGESLEKEHVLMMQQKEGLYEGTLQDWASEIHRVKVTAEVDAIKEELAFWKHLAEVAERELRHDVAAAKKKHEDAETAQQSKLLEATEISQIAEKPTKPNMAEGSSSVHSVPTALHGLVALVQPLPSHAQRRRALIVGCNYPTSHSPLQGCVNDVWNLQCLLRHTLQYGDDQVRCLIDGSESCPSMSSRHPTRANILEGIRWLVHHAHPGDNLFFAFCGHGARLSHYTDVEESYLVPSDFAEDLPTGFFARRAATGAPASIQAEGKFYRLVSLADLSNALARLPAGCKVTVVHDCSVSQLPGVPIETTTQVHPPAATPEALGSNPRGDGFAASRSRPRRLELPPLPTSSAPPPIAPLRCACHCFSACSGPQWCSEFPIEGSVQGAFTWSFVKAMTAGHLRTTVQQHGFALQNILGDLQSHFKWMRQTPVVQLSASAKPQDYVLVS